MSTIDFTTVLGSFKTSLISTLNTVLPIVMSILIVFAGVFVVIAVGKLAIGWIKRLGSAR